MYYSKLYLASVHKTENEQMGKGSINSLRESLKSSVLLEDLVGLVKCASLDKGGPSQFAEHKDMFSPVHLSTVPRDPGEDTQTPLGNSVSTAVGSKQHQTSQFQFRNYTLGIVSAQNSLTVSVAISFADILAPFGHSKLITI